MGWAPGSERLEGAARLAGKTALSSSVARLGWLTAPSLFWWLLTSGSLVGAQRPVPRTCHGPQPGARVWTVLFKGLCVARKLFHNDPSAEALMTARAGFTLKSPYQNNSSAVSTAEADRTFKRSSERSHQPSAETEQYGLCSETCQSHLFPPHIFKKALKT